MKRGSRIILLATLAAGCSPASYKQSADLQVEDLLRDRKQQTLGYEPQTEAETTVAAKPTKRAYERIPTSPLPPPTTAPIEPLGETIPYGPLGPDLLWRVPGSVDSQAVREEALGGESVLAPLGPPTLAKAYRQLDLFGCLQYAVQNSRSYQDRMEDLYLVALEVTLQRHLLSPRPFARQSLDYAGTKDDFEYRSALNAVTSVGVRQELPYGGEVVAQSIVGFVDALSGNASEGDNARAVLSGSLPLLRGAGLINLEGLINSERQVVYEVRAFEDFRRSFAVDIASRYFRLLTQQQAVFNRKLNLINTRNLTERSQALFNAGLSNFLEVQRALQSQFSAESSLIDALASYENALDSFKLALGMPVEERLDVVPVALDVNIPRVDANEAVELAYQYRLSLQTASDRIEDARRSVANARNGLLPSLDLTGSVDVSNEPDTKALSFRDRTNDYRAGVTLDLPIDRVAERNAYRRALIALERSQRSYVSAKESITVSVRDALRGIRSAEINVEIQQRGIDLAQRRMDNANTLLQQGRIGNRDVVEAQNALLSAQDAYEQARGQLQIRVLEYMRDTGTLRVDPKAGAIARAMDRRALQATKTAPEQ